MPRPYAVLEHAKLPKAEVPAARRRFATILDFTKARETGSLSDVKARFPIYDRAHAKNALARLSQARGTTPAVRRVVAQRAANVLGEVTPGARKHGVTRLTLSPVQAVTQAPVRVIERRQAPVFAQRRVPFPKKRPLAPRGRRTY